MNQTPRSMDATSPSLLARVQANQPGSWERLVDLYAPLVYHWCRRSALGPEDAADVFQEVFRSVAEHIAGFRRDRAGATFRGWLRTITRNKIHDHFRRLQGRARAAGGTDAQLRLLAVPDAPDEEDAEEAGLLHRQVRGAVEASAASSSRAPGWRSGRSRSKGNPPPTWGRRWG